MLYSFSPKYIITTITYLILTCGLCAQVNYPFPIHYIQPSIENMPVRMAYMDVHPDSANGKTVLLLHGKNFNGYYWKDVIPFFTENGFRVIVPDQPGWGRSDKPDLHYSFHLLAQATRQLLDSLQTEKVIVVGHSMGGMLATRFTLLYPGMVEKLVLENPIGLEDYRRFVPYQPLEKLMAKEKSATYESYKKYQQTYYPEWKPEYEQYVQAQAEALNSPHFEQIAYINALTYQMIYEQPVCYEWDLLQPPVLLVIGQEDRTIVGKAMLTGEQKQQYGQYPELGRNTQALIPQAKLVELPGIGHIPHIQNLQQFQLALLDFIRNRVD